MDAPTKPKPPRADRRVPVARIQKLLAAIEKKITASESDAVPADQKLKPREMIGLANSAAGLSRILREIDREGHQSKQAKKAKDNWPL
jgi:hypothetical protein